MTYYGGGNMNLDLGLKLTQEQKLIMTMQMQLSIKLLQMSSYELLQHINKELQENIVLECSEANFESVDPSDEKKELINYKELIKYLEFDEYSNGNYKTTDTEEEISPFNFISNKVTLKDFLIEQLIETNIDAEKFKICRYIVDNLDDRGYLDYGTIDISKDLLISIELFDECLAIVQSLEPCGVAARDLKECLLLQLDSKGIRDYYFEEIINEYLVLLSENKYAAIGKKLGITPLEVQRYGDLIKELEPKPSRGYFTGEETSYIIPDAYIRKIDDEYIILMNDNIIPKLNINNTYKDVINHSEDKVAVDYVKDKISSAMSLIKSIENRKTTLYKVIQEIVNFQKDYFNYGDDYLKPMTIKAISIKLNLHESTVSRAIRDKYIALNNGNIKRIKDLFTNSLNYHNEDLSTLNIKNMIKEIVENENKKKPLSDSNICELLNNKGLNISRRTVAKYREEIGVKSSSQRKRL
jgi:RNA polymerase sigma-54 factor